MHIKYSLVVLSLPIEARPVGLEHPRVLTGQVHFHVEGSWEKKIPRLSTHCLARASYLELINLELCACFFSHLSAYSRISLKN